MAAWSSRSLTRPAVGLGFEVGIEDAKLVFQRYLDYPRSPNVPPPTFRNIAGTRLTLLTVAQFRMMVTDVHHELVRRNSRNSESEARAPRLPSPNPTRQRCRIMLATTEDLTDLVAGILLELRRRNLVPEIEASDRSVPPVSHSDVTSGPIERPPLADKRMNNALANLTPNNAERRKSRVLSLHPTSPKRRFARESRLCLDGKITGVSEHPVAAGGYADVWKGVWRGQPVAIKVMRPFESTGRRIHRNKLMKRLWREFLSWTSHSHPNIIPCLGFSYDFSQGRDVPSLISPWMSNGTVLTYLDTDPDISARLDLIMQVGLGLCFLHSENPAIVHGDLRAANILVSDSGVPCITDFGLAKILNGTHGMTTTTQIAGSLRWQSPELLRYEVSAVTPSSDVWAFGMTALEILTGKRPYYNIKMDPAVLCQIIEGKLPMVPSNVVEVTAAEVWAVFLKCWGTPASVRPDMSEVVFDLKKLV